MSRVYLALIQENQGNPSILLAQNNIYLPAHGKYTYATVAQGGMQFTIPNCKVKEGEDPAATIIHEVEDSLGISLNSSLLKKLEANANFIVFIAGIPSDINVGAINYNLDINSLESVRYHQIQLLPLEESFSTLGNLNIYHTEGWVIEQVERALMAGFTEKFINERINTDHKIYTWILAKLIADVYFSTFDPQSTNSNKKNTDILSAPAKKQC